MARSRTSSRSDAQPRGHRPALFRLHRLGRRHLSSPWTLYAHYGDRDVLKERCPRWSAGSTSLVDQRWAAREPARGWAERGFTFGDWLQPSGPTEKPLPTIGDDAAATIYLYISTAKLAEIARFSARPRSPPTCTGAPRPSRRPSPANSSRPAGVWSTTTRRPTPSISCTTSFLRTSRRRRRPISARPSARGRPHRHRLHRHAGAAAGAGEDRRSRSRRRGLPAGGGSGLALSGQARGDDDLGALGRHQGGRHDLRPRHEFLQPLRLWRGLPVAVRGGGGLSARPGGARLQAHRDRADHHQGAGAGSSASSVKPGADRSQLVAGWRRGCLRLHHSAGRRGHLGQPAAYAGLQIDGRAPSAQPLGAGAHRATFKI